MPMIVGSGGIEETVQLQRVELPIELQKTFNALCNTPLFYVSYCKKLNADDKVQRRVVLCTLDHFYACHPNGDILRCFPFFMIERIIHDPIRHQLALVVPEEYDVAMEVPNTYHFIEVVQTLRSLRPETAAPLIVQYVLRTRKDPARDGLPSRLLGYPPSALDGEDADDDEYHHRTARVHEEEFDDCGNALWNAEQQQQHHHEDQSHHHHNNVGSSSESDFENAFYRNTMLESTIALGVSNGHQMMGDERRKHRRLRDNRSPAAMMGDPNLGSFGQGGSATSGDYSFSTSFSHQGGGGGHHHYSNGNESFYINQNMNGAADFGSTFVGTRREKKRSPSPQAGAATDLSTWSVPDAANLGESVVIAPRAQSHRPHRGRATTAVMNRYRSNTNAALDESGLRSPEATNVASPQANGGMDNASFAGHNRSMPAAAGITGGHPSSPSTKLTLMDQCRDWWYYFRQAVPIPFLRLYPPGVIVNWNDRFYKDPDASERVRQRHQRQYRSQYERRLLFRWLFWRERQGRVRMSIHNPLLPASEECIVDTQSFIDDDPFVFGENVAGQPNEVCIGKGMYAVRLEKPLGWRLCLYKGSADGDEEEFDLPEDWD